MPHTQPYNLWDEQDRLRERRERLVDEAVGLERQMLEFEEVPDDLRDEYQETLAEGHQTDRYLTGLEWALNPADKDPIEEITVSALTAGDEQWVTGRTDALADRLANKWGTDSEDVDGGRVLHVAAVGIEDCPRFAGSPDPEERVDIVRGWHPSFVRWLASRVDDLSTPEVEGKNFGELLKERRSDGGPDSDGHDSS